MDEWEEIHRKCLADAVIKREADAFEWADGYTDWLKWELGPGGTVITPSAHQIMMTGRCYDQFLEFLNLKIINTLDFLN